MGEGDQCYRTADSERDQAVELGVEEKQCGRYRCEGREDRCRWSRPDREEESEGEAHEPEQDPEPAAEICAESLEGDREERHPRRRKERKNAVDAEADEGAPPGDVELGPALHAEVVQMAWILDDEPAAGCERGPVGVDDVVLAFDQRIDDKAEGNARQGDRPAPLPAGLRFHVVLSMLKTRVTGVISPPWMRRESRTTP